MIHLTFTRDEAKFLVVELSSIIAGTLRPTPLLEHLIALLRIAITAGGPDSPPNPSTPLKGPAP